MKTGLAVLIVFIAIPVVAQNDPEHPRIPTSSQEFIQGTPQALKLLGSSDFEQGLETPSLGASAEQDFQRLVVAINAKHPIPNVSVGDPTREYDVILQPGHYQRTSGRTGTQGKYVSEQALVAYLTTTIASSLRRTGESVLIVSADNYVKATREGTTFHGLHGKVFLAIHADGSPRPCSTGPSLGYQGPTTALTMNFIALGLGDALGYDYASFRRNFTANEADYYMFREVMTQQLKGLLEVGELTCADSERQLILSSDAVGNNVARAIDFIVKEGPPPD